MYFQLWFPKKNPTIVPFVNFLMKFTKIIYSKNEGHNILRNKLLSVFKGTRTKKIKNSVHTISEADLGGREIQAPMFVVKICLII